MKSDFNAEFKPLFNEKRILNCTPCQGHFELV